MADNRIFFAILFLMFGFAGELSAHETWLGPSEFYPAINQPVRFDLTSGMKFPALDYPIKAERIEQARVRLGNVSSKFEARIGGKNALRFVNSFSQTGVAAAWVVFHPKRLELSDQKVAEYFAEINAPAEVRDTWARLKGREKWKEVYTKCAKTILRVGGDVNDDSWRQPVEIPFEIIPLSDPTKWHAGENATFQLLENGRPLPNVSLGLLLEGEERSFKLTDSDGKATLPLRKVSRALFFAVHLRRMEEQHQWRSNFTTLTGLVHPAEP